MKQPEYITTDLNGTIIESNRVVEDCQVKVIRDENTGLYSYSIKCQATFPTHEAAVANACESIRAASFTRFTWVPLIEM